MADFNAQRPRILPLLERAGLPLWLVDSKRVIRFANRAALDRLGATHSAVVGEEIPYAALAPDGPTDQRLLSLSPPPEVLSGKALAILIPPSVSVGSSAATFANFLPLSPDGPASSVLVFLTDKPWLPLANETYLERHGELLRFRQQQRQHFLLEQLVGKSPAIERVRQRSALAALTPVSVMIQGPQGSGRRSLARAIHYQRTAGQSPLLTWSVEFAEATLAETIHELTADAGEVPGTLLIQGIPRLSVPLRERLFAVIRERMVQVIMVCKSEDRVEADPELLAAVSTLEIVMPPLRERRADVPLLIQATLEQVAHEAGQAVPSLQPDALELLLAYDWPGDLAQLHQVLSVAVTASRSAQLGASDFSASLRSAIGHSAPTETPIVLDEFLQQVEEELIRRALKRSGGNKAKAARLLGLSRPRLYRRMVQLNLIEIPEGWPTAIDDESLEESLPDEPAES